MPTKPLRSTEEHHVPSASEQPLTLTPFAYHRVQYATGEFETLDLDEVISNGHMSLLAR